MGVKLLTLPQLAAEAGISRQRLHEHIEAGHIQADFETVNGRALFKQTSVECVRWQLCLNRLLQHKN